MLLEDRPGARDNVGLVEQNATGFRRGIQDRRQQPAVPTGDIDDGRVAAEVVAGGPRFDPEPRYARHGVVEHLVESLFFAQVLEDWFTAQAWDNGPAGANGFGHMAPVLPLLGCTHKPGESAQRD